MSLYVNHSSQTLQILLQGSDKIVQVETTISIPLTHVKLPIEVHPSEATTALKWPTLSHVPDIYASGPLFSHDTKTYLSMRNPDRTVAINIDHDIYCKFVVEVEPGKTPEQVRDEIHNAVEEAREWDRIQQKAKEANRRLESNVIDAL